MRAQAPAGSWPDCTGQLEKAASSFSSSSSPFSFSLFLHLLLQPWGGRGSPVGRQHPPASPCCLMTHCLAFPLTQESTLGIPAQIEKDTRTATNISRHPPGRGRAGRTPKSRHNDTRGARGAVRPRTREGSCTWPRKTPGDNTATADRQLWRGSQERETESARDSSLPWLCVRAECCLKRKLVFPEHQACSHPSPPLPKSPRHRQVPGTLSTISGPRGAHWRCSVVRMRKLRLCPHRPAR